MAVGSLSRTALIVRPTPESRNRLSDHHDEDEDHQDDVVVGALPGEVEDPQLPRCEGHVGTVWADSPVKNGRK